MTDKDLEIRITLNTEQRKQFNEVVDKSEGNKTFVKQKLFTEALAKLHKRLHKPQSVLDTLASKENE